MSKFFPRTTLYTLLSLSLAANMAHAGAKSVDPVSVGSTHISGSFGSARNSADPTQSLYCQLTPTSLICQGIDAFGVARACMSTDPALYTAFYGISDSSFIHIGYSGATCTELTVVKASGIEPKN